MDANEVVKTLLLFEREMVKNPKMHGTILGFIHNMESRIGYRNLSTINADSTCSAHLDLLQESTRLLYEIIMTYKHKNDDELALLGVGIRLFNDIVCSFRLIVTGYYQIAFSIQRDLLETGFLLDYFGIDKSLITEWRTCTQQERRRGFHPKKIRNALDERDGFTSGKRERDYRLFCEYASHPTHGGSKLISRDGLAETGPFHDEIKLKSAFFELTKQTDLAIANFICHFEDMSNELKQLVNSYVQKSREWFSKYVR